MVGWLTPGCWRRGGGASRGRDAGEGRQASPQGGCELTHFYTVSFTLGGSVVEPPFPRASTACTLNSDRRPGIALAPYRLGRSRWRAPSPLVVAPTVGLAPLIEIGRSARWPSWARSSSRCAGAYLVRRQGLGVLRRMREEMVAGQTPAACRGSTDLKQLALSRQTA